MQIEHAQREIWNIRGAIVDSALRRNRSRMVAIAPGAAWGRECGGLAGDEFARLLRWGVGGWVCCAVIPACYTYTYVFQVVQPQHPLRIYQDHSHTGRQNF